MPARAAFDYAIVRVVPRVEREEFVNAGAIVHCRTRRYLAARIALDERRLLALDPRVDLELVRRHLDAFPRIAAGDPDAGPIARLDQHERFHWLVAPRSTIVQTSAVHPGVCDDPDEAMARILARTVAPPT